MKVTIKFGMIAAALLAIAALNVTGCKQPSTPAGQTANAAATTVKYTCPMHPEIVQDKPGNCPKCGMALVEKK